MKCLEIRVRGRVQGVFFRASTQEVADRLGIRGIVRNEPDGSVFIEAEGEEADLEAFLAWCRKGPPHARVDHVGVADGEPRRRRSFEITR